ncbi:AAA family ATPase [Agromyces sp. NPDC058110]|uniref:AAA family ATPase n=1 Tax=Agromyces sp. NPDC058110 TaxID=3346345 RepID=UPI0036DCA5C2
MQLSDSQVFGSGQEEVFVDYEPSPGKVTYFVGRNGSGKSRVARALAQGFGGRYLSTDRLMGIMSVTQWAWGAAPSDYKGPPIGDNRSLVENISREHGMATDTLLSLREDPVVGLKVAAFLRKSLGRTIEFRESAGFFDPYVRLGGTEYSLLRDEGHGLRELTILLAAVYSTDWTTLVVDEPELHLHPALAQLWISELNRECEERGVHAIVVTHEPSMIRPISVSDLDYVWLFQPGQKPTAYSSAVIPGTESRIDATLLKNPQLVSQLSFAPRPVLVEGAHDVAAITAALARSQTAAVVAQTELAQCGSSGEVGLWFELALTMGLDVRAIADLDALFSSDVQRTIDRNPSVQSRLRSELLAEPPRAHVALRPLIDAANLAGVEKNEKARARWLADDVAADSGNGQRREKLLDMLRETGLWLHPQGTLEDVLGIVKGESNPALAAATPGAIDSAAEWCSYDLDPLGDLEHLLNLAIERIANNLTQAIGVTPGVVLSGPVGPMSQSDAKLVGVEHVGSDRYRITVKAPTKYAGCFVEVDRLTPPSQIVLSTPNDGSAAGL